MRLDTQAGAFADRGGYRVIQPGQAAQSELFQRISAADAKVRMPPASTGRRLSPREIELVRRWIDGGAQWQAHWSLLPPQRPALPAVRAKHWPRNPIDYFVLARLEREGLRPSAEAARTTLIRRVSLDLTGLPPTPAEVDAFLADSSPDAYEKVVDRLLQSPRYGERMALPWLNAARYADTNGYQTDGERIMWRWRDWVIDAFNANMPFDQFTIEQIAGDMLPNATVEQRIATGFNRNHRGNSEGGVIPEEYAVEYVVDRVDTTFTVWLGLTMGCAKCHDHKYEPISQKEFYQVFAYFNNVPEKGKAIKYGNSPPYIKSPTRQQQVQLEQLRRHVQQLEDHCRSIEPELAARQSAWEEHFLRNPTRIDWSPPRGLVAHYPLEDNAGNQCTPARPAQFCNGEPGYGTGRIGRAAYFDGKRFLDAGDTGDFGFFDKFSLAAWVLPRGSQEGTILSRMADTARAEGYSLVLENGKLHVNLIKRWLDDAIRVETEAGLEPERWHHVLVTYDASRVADGIKVYLDGQAQKLKVNLDDLNQSFQTKEPFRIGGGGERAFHGAIDDVRIFNRALSLEEAAVVATAESIDALLAVSAERRSPGQKDKLRAYYLENRAPGHLRDPHRRLVEARDELTRFDESLPTTMVMEEMPTPRDTHVLIRGDYDKQGAKVAPGTPSSLPALPQAAPNNRLGFARWLVDPSNPLTARVAVNRHWQMLLGSGLVKSVEDFGSQGQWPSHRDLLDWLATEYIRVGWDTKALLRTMVTSATYRQSSSVTKALRERDPENRLLARGPRVRLSAEMIRDQALFVSGLLVERQGGPSVRPYQPPGLEKELHGTDDYQQDKGANLYRRSLYTFWKRTVPPPAMMNLDAASRETCVVREARTNTPLQALNLLNDVTFVEAARVLAQRLMQKPELGDEQKLQLAFRLATARNPTREELDVLQAGLRHHRERFRHDVDAARKLVSIGEYPRGDTKIDELAALTATASLLLNLDEVITKE